MNKILSFILLCLLFPLCGMAQENVYYLGCELDPVGDDSIPEKVELLTRDYTTLPRNYSLKRYSPYPKSQGQYGTCTSWSTTYAARTICEAINRNWTDRQLITNEAFAPIFIYAQIDYSGYRNCQSGTRIPDALSVLKQKGCPKLSSFNVLCSCNLTSSLYQLAYPNRISDYTLLFDSYCYDNSKRIRTIKKALTEKRPVVVSMACYNSFYDARGVWNGSHDTRLGNHAMCVVGYDDDMFGGAFEIMNNWGSSWGNSGYIWVRYTDFCNAVNSAYEMYVRPSGYTPVETKGNYLSGTIRLQLATDEMVAATLLTSSTVPYYKMSGSYVTGTRCRLYISNGQPCYVYVLASDDRTGMVTKVFPSSSKISPALTYSSSNIAIPHEDQFFQLDDTPGRSYLCVIYSIAPLDIQNVIQTISAQSGTFYERVRKGLSAKIVPLSNLSLSNSSIRFSSKSDRTVVPVILEINHK